MTLGQKKMDGDLPKPGVLRLLIRSIELNKSLERRILNIWLADHLVFDFLLVRQFALWPYRYNINAPLFWLGVLMARNLVQNRHRLSTRLRKSDSCCRTFNDPLARYSQSTVRMLCSAYSKIKRVLFRISSLKFHSWNNTRAYSKLID